MTAIISENYIDTAYSSFAFSITNVMWLCCCCSCALIVASLPPYFLGIWVFVCFVFFARRIRVNTSRTNWFFKFFLDFDDANSDFQAIAYYNVQQLLSLVILPHDRSIFFLALTGAQLYILKSRNCARLPFFDANEMLDEKASLVFWWGLFMNSTPSRRGRVYGRQAVLYVMWKSPETGRSYRPSACSQQSGNTIRKHLSPQSCGWFEQHVPGWLMIPVRRSSLLFSFLYAHCPFADCVLDTLAWL